MRIYGETWAYHMQTRVDFFLQSDQNIISQKSPLRVEFLLKTDSEYPRDAEVTLFTLANPEHSLRFNTHWSAPPVSALARSRGPRKMSQSPVSRNSNTRETYGQAQGRSGGHQGSSVNRRCQLSFVGRLWHRRSPLPQGNRLFLNVSVRYRAG